MEVYTVDAILDAARPNFLANMLEMRSLKKTADTKTSQTKGSSGGNTPNIGVLDKVSEQIAKIDTSLNNVQGFLTNAEGVNQKLSEFAANFGFEAVGSALESVNGFLATAQNVSNDLAPFISKATEMVGVFKQISSGVETAQILMMIFSDEGFGGLGKAIMGLMGGPWGLIIAGIVALVAGFTYLWNTNEGFRTAIIEIWTAISDMFNQVITTIVNFIKETWGAMVAWWNDSNNGIRVAAEALWGAIKEFITTVVEGIFLIVQTIWGALTSFWNEHNETIKAVASTVWEAIKNFIQAAITTISSVISSVLSIIQNIWEVVWNGIQFYLETVMKTMTAVIQTATNMFRSIVETIMNLIKGDWAGAWESIKNTVSAAWDGIKKVVEIGLEAAHKVITGWFSIFKDAGGNLVKMIGDGIMSGVTGVTNAIKSVVGKIRDFLPFSPAKTGPLSDLDQLNFGGTIATGIYAGEKQITKAMDSILSTPSLDNLDQTLNSRSLQSISTKSEVTLRTAKQPAVFNVKLGNQQFKAFVSDISQAIGSETSINMAF